MSERTCPWCKDAFELAMKDGHLACPECRTYLVKKGEPGWDEGFSKRIGMEEYWMIPPAEDSNPLKVIR